MPIVSAPRRALGKRSTRVRSLGRIRPGGVIVFTWVRGILLPSEAAEAPRAFFGPGRVASTVPRRRRWPLLALPFEFGTRAHPEVVISEATGTIRFQVQGSAVKRERSA